MTSELAKIIDEYPKARAMDDPWLQRQPEFQAMLRRKGQSIALAQAVPYPRWKIRGVLPLHVGLALLGWRW